MKRFFSFAFAMLLTISVAITPASAKSSSIYGPYDSFEELYDAYMQAVERGDLVTQAELLEIGKTSLKEEIKMSEQYSIQPAYDAIEAYWRDEVLPQYFSYGYFEERYDGTTLSLGNKLSYWSSEDKDTGWTATHISFGKDPQWDNTECMKEQFYCHARLVYALIEKEWNLEPWKTSIDPFTCN